MMTTTVLCLILNIEIFPFQMKPGRAQRIFVCATRRS